MEQVGISTVYYLELGEGDAAVDPRFPQTQIRSVALAEVKEMAFWTQDGATTR